MATESHCNSHTVTAYAHCTPSQQFCTWYSLLRNLGYTDQQNKKYRDDASCVVLPSIHKVLTTIGAPFFTSLTTILTSHYVLENIICTCPGFSPGSAVVWQ